MSYQEDLILSIYGRGEPWLAMADPLPKDDPNRRVPAPGKDGVPSSPYLPGKSPIPSKGLAMDVNDALPRGGFVGTTRTNVFVNDGGEAFIREPNGNMKFDGFYDPSIHGPMFPGLGLVRANDSMMIAKRKKSDEQRAYEDFVRDSKEADLMEAANDSMIGRQGGGLYIMQDLLDIYGV